MSSTAGYAYRALRHDGSVERGTLDAASNADAVSALERMGLLAIDVAVVQSARDRRRPLPSSDLALGLRVLAELLESGLPISRALATLEELAPISWKPVLPPMRQAVREGKSLGGALREAPAELPAVVVGMIAAGEAAGNVAGAVRRAAEITESMAETRDAVRSALAYPALLGVTGTGVIGLMIGVVIPRFAAILNDLGSTLPPTTRFVLDLAAVARSVAVPVAVTSVAVVIALRAWMSTADGRRSVHAALLRVPIVGGVREAMATARASLTLGTLLETAVPVRHAIPYCATASGDAEIEARLRSAGARVESGESITTACRDTGALTPLALRLVQAGEESGRLAAMLRHAAKLEQARADRTSRAAVRMLEPALILVFAGVVALVAAALLQAVYAIRPTP